MELCTDLVHASERLAVFVGAPAGNDSDYSLAVAEISPIVEKAARIIISENDPAYILDDKSSLQAKTTVFQYIREKRPDFIPKSIQRYIEILKNTRNQAVHANIIMYSDFLLYVLSLKAFLHWFFSVSQTVKLLNEHDRVVLRKAVSCLDCIKIEFKTQGDSLATQGASDESANTSKIIEAVSNLGGKLQNDSSSMAGKANNEKATLHGSTCSRDLDIMIYEKLLNFEENTYNRFQEINGKLDSVKDMLQRMENSIDSYKTLCQKQMDRADGEDEKERIVSSICEEIAQRAESQVISNESLADKAKIKNAKEELIELFSSSAWEKMTAESQSFLISARVSFALMEPYGDHLDYSGVCILVAEAFEKELRVRFIERYGSYVFDTFGENIKAAPTAFKKRNNNKEWNKLDTMTLGNIPYIFCQKGVDKNPEEAKRDLNCLVNYSRDHIFNENCREKIPEILKKYSDYCDFVVEQYRNPAAHSSTIKRVQAEECMNYILLVQKALKEMLDSFIN